jgi:hypothetical protein
MKMVAVEGMSGGELLDHAASLHYLVDHTGTRTLGARAA